MPRRILALAASVAMVFALGGPASGDAQPPESRSPTDGPIDTPPEVHEAHDHDAQHGPSEGHIAPSSENVDLVGVWTAPRTKNKPGRITDVWSKGDFAYLGTFAPPCSGLGVHVVDISDPANPQKAGFIPSRPGTRVNDVKVFHFDGLASGFTGDILLHSNENCSAHPQRVGGISLWDVTDPTDPQPLARGVGDTTTTDDEGNEVTLPRARQVHNIYAWQDGSSAFAVIVDDEEILDVDILDITDPTNPVHIAETGLPDWPAATVDGNGGTVFNHDVWVKEIGAQTFLLSSYWDAGFVVLDVTNPATPVFVGDSDYPDPDPFTGISPQEGNGHAAVWSEDSQFVLAGDEDFSPFRIDPFEITTGPNAGEFPAGEFGWTRPVADFPGDAVQGPTVYGGSACPGQDLDENGTDDRADVPDASVLDGAVGPDDERVLVTTRGTCFFSDKVRSGEEKGYDVVIIGNHHVGAGGGAFPDAHVCGGQGSPVLGTAAGLCIGHRAMHLLFNDDVEFEPETGATSPDMPPTGTLGERISAEAFFDGWGPFHLIDATSLEEVDAFAPPEVHDVSFAFGFGDLTMHNVEAFGPGKAAISWYSLGLRVLDFSACTAAPDGDTSNQDDPGCIQEVGHFIDEGGNNFWGVHIASDHPTDPELILASDRDRGLYILKFTG